MVFLFLDVVVATGGERFPDLKQCATNGARHEHPTLIK